MAAGEIGHDPLKRAWTGSSKPLRVAGPHRVANTDEAATYAASARLSPDVCGEALGHFVLRPKYRRHHLPKGNLAAGHLVQLGIIQWASIWSHERHSFNAQLVRRRAQLMWRTMPVEEAGRCDSDHIADRAIRTATDVAVATTKEALTEAAMLC